MKQILSIKITLDRNAKSLWLSQEKYIENVLEDKAKLVSVSLDNHFKLSSKQILSNEKEKEDMEGVPYSSIVGSLMYI